MDEATTQERRAFPRFRAHRLVAYCVRADVAISYDVANVSLGGALLTSGPRIRVGELVDVLLLTRSRVVATPARIIWLPPGIPRKSGMAVRFLPSCTDERFGIVELVGRIAG